MNYFFILLFILLELFVNNPVKAQNLLNGAELSKKPIYDAMVTAMQKKHGST